MSAEALPVAPDGAIPRRALVPLLARRDRPAWTHLGVQLIVGAAAVFATLRLAAADHPAVWIAVAVLSLVVVTLFPTLHEAGHGTAFRSRFGNELAVWLGALAMLQVPSFFREFHWTHHRETQDPERDPEIAEAPSLLDDWPSNPVVYLGLVSGLPLMVGKLYFTLACALLPARARLALFPFIRPDRNRRIAWESRLGVALLGGGAALGLATVPHFALLLLAWPLAHLVLGFYLMTEHTGLPGTGNQLERTRTVRSNALVRWLMWNMPYHAEHHAHPGVPFHALPALHASLADALPHQSSGYLAFHREAVRRAFGGAAPDSDASDGG